MLAIECTRFGLPHEVAEVVEVPDPGAPGEGEVVIDVLAAPINPSDLLFFQGRYGAAPPPLPAVAGGEAVGRIAAIGPGVPHLAVGDRVLTLFAGRGSWRQRIKARAETLFPLPDARTSQLAMLAVNPATAWLMLTEFVVLRAGDWVLQNAGNSGVGHNVVRLGRALGLRTISVVRQEDQVAPLSAIGADAVLVDGDDLPARVEAATGGARPRLAFDAVAGEATRRLADCLAEGGVVVNYGMLSGGPCTVDPSAIVFRDISLCGFWLGKWFQRTDPEIKRRLYDKLCGLVADGTIDVPVEATYTLPQIRDALRHAAQPHRSGKVLLLPNGPIEG